jgi:hypothetical protein
VVVVEVEVVVEVRESSIVHECLSCFMVVTD